MEKTVYSADVPRRICGHVPDHGIKATHDLCPGGGSCSQFVKDLTGAKHKEAKHNKMRYACDLAARRRLT